MIRKLIRAKFNNQFEDKLLDEMVSTGEYIEKQKDEYLIDSGEYLRSFPLIITGLLRIIRLDQNGDEILLYYLMPGETCAVSLTCCMAAKKSTIRAVVEEDTEMIVFPIRKLDEWMVKYPSWKGFVMETLQNRFEELLKAVDDLAFNRMDNRLQSYLISRQEATGLHELEVTHIEIARDLNTSREVDSRLLKKMEQDGKVVLSRNNIKIISLVGTEF